MTLSRPFHALMLFAAATIVSSAGISGQTKKIDVKQSSFKISVFKSGFFSAFGHNHEIQAPISVGTVDQSKLSVALGVESADLQVMDPDASPSTRADVQKTMLGPEVLDSRRFPQISFQSTSIEISGSNRWRVRGDLTLHGQTRPLTLDVDLENGHYRGSLMLKQRDFGIAPVSVAGGTVKVKNEIKIEFDIVLEP